MLLNYDQFVEEASRVATKSGGAVGFDFETDGLNPYKGARAFIMGWADETGKYSVNLKHLDSHGKFHLLHFFSNKTLHYAAHNAKFEMSFLDQQFGIEIAGIIWDSEVMARVEYNNHLRYSLQHCAQRFGESKYIPAMEWLAKNKKSYHTMPQELIVPYVEQDAWLSWELRRRQIETFKHWDMSGEIPIHRVVQLETEVLRPLFRMEKAGLLVDIEYCKKALAYELQQIQTAQAKFKELTGEAFIDSAKSLRPHFDRAGLTYGKTEKGNPSFNSDSLAACGTHPLIDCIIQHRSATKRASTYWENFIEYADANGIIHPNIHQNRAATGRMSITQPAAQTFPRDDDDAEPAVFPTRRAFTARPGRIIASLDFKQMELVLMTNESGDPQMIKAIRDGADLHQETADLAGVRRSLAKNGRFAKLYGAGVARVAQTLKVDMVVAKKICDAIDATAKRTTQYTRELIKYAERAAYCFDYYGRRFFFDAGWAYLYPNYRIQGAGNEILKKSIIACSKILEGTDTYFLLPVHDELLLDMPSTDSEKSIHLLKTLKRSMEAQYTGRHIPLTVSVAIGPNMYDLEEINV